MVTVIGTTSRKLNIEYAPRHVTPVHVKQGTTKQTKFYFCVSSFRGRLPGKFFNEKNIFLKNKKVDTLTLTVTVTADCTR